MSPRSYVFLLLSVLQFQVGGGFAQIFLVLLVAAATSQIHARPAWFKVEGMISSAVRHALAAGEAAWAARLVEQHVEELLPRGEGETLRRWLDMPLNVILILFLGGPFFEEPEG